ncbi:MAG TPA: D-alanyl-D-alanine carboxypeptidase [Candidatus Eisenbacteria bacterium]|nr:D-alanyl-D-alanine carboxypeptidase [Candidatus Eisenbacteria bacterium]
MPGRARGRGGVGAALLAVAIAVTIPAASASAETGGLSTADAEARGPGVCAEGARGVFGAALDSILGPELAGAQIGLLAVSAARHDTLLAYREGRRLIPGSNAKLFTTGALLALHGPSARRLVTIEARGKVKRSEKRGRPPEIAFKGDLTLHPSGMPDIVPLRSPGSRGLLDSLAFLLRASGLEKFEGTLYVDRTLFAAEAVPPGWGADDVAYGYGAPVGPVLANGNAALVIAREEGGSVRIALDPPDTPIAIRAAGVTLGDSGSAGWLTPRWAAGSRVLELSGSVPRGGEVKRSVAMSDPDSAAAWLLLAAMRREGIEVKKVSLGFLLPAAAGSGPIGPDAWRGVEWGENRAWRESAPAAERAGPSAWDSVSAARAAAVISLPSPTLLEALAVVNPQSLNVEAEGLLRLASPAGWAKSRREGIAQIYRLAAEAGIDTLDLSLVDGSGLSPQDLVTPRAVVRWLERCDAADSSGGSLRATLALPGQPGTLEQRFTGLPPGSEFRAKTGTLTNVSSLSGYLRTAEGEEIVLTMIVNGARKTVAPVRGAEERLVQFLARVPRERGAPFLPFGWRPR